MLYIISVMQDCRDRRVARRVRNEWGEWLSFIGRDPGGKWTAYLRGDIKVTYNSRGKCLDPDHAEAAHSQRRGDASRRLWQFSTQPA